jgi:hypothetical protein
MQRAASGCGEPLTENLSAARLDLAAEPELKADVRKVSELARTLA